MTEIPLLTGTNEPYDHPAVQIIGVFAVRTSSATHPTARNTHFFLLSSDLVRPAVRCEVFRALDGVGRAAAVADAFALPARQQTGTQFGFKRDACGLKKVS